MEALTTLRYTSVFYSIGKSTRDSCGCIGMFKVNMNIINLWLAPIIGAHVCKNDRCFMSLCRTCSCYMMNWSDDWVRIVKW